MPRAAYALIALALVACSSGGSTGSGTTLTTASPTTTLATTTTTVTLQPVATAHGAASAFIAAWKAGDAATASTVALTAAVQSAFAAGTPAFAEDRGCMQGDFDPIACVFRTDLGEAQVRSTKSGDGWIVDQVIVSPA